jgi:hypothetical protein
MDCCAGRFAGANTAKMDSAESKQSRRNLSGQSRFNIQMKIAIEVSLENFPRWHKWGLAPATDYESITIIRCWTCLSTMRMMAAGAQG